MNITWKIENLNRRESTGYVEVAYWSATIIDGNFNATIKSSCQWNDGEITVPFENLTEEIVLNWIWDIVDKSIVEDSLNSQLELEKLPKLVSGIPWSK